TRAVERSDEVCTGLQLVNFLQDVPRDLELGRIYLPREDRERFGNPALDRPSPELRELLRFEAERARRYLLSGDELRAILGGRIGRAVGLFARGGLAALDAFAREVDDVADGSLSLDEKRARLEALRASLDAEPTDATTIALHDARRRFPIPSEALSALVDGGLQDLEQTRYASFD